MIKSRFSSLISSTRDICPLKSISSKDQEEIRDLVKNLATAKKELHELNAQKMTNVQEEVSTGNEKESGTKRRVYSSPLGKAVGEKELENCRKISSIVNRIDSEISQELDKDIRIASQRLNEAGDSSAKGSADDLYFWCKNELLPLLNKSEQIAHLCLKQIAGNEEPKP
jgi:hypothetical protein